MCEEVKDLCKECQIRKGCGLALVIDGLCEMAILESPDIWIVRCDDFIRILSTEVGPLGKDTTQ